MFPMILPRFWIYGKSFFKTLRVSRVHFGCIRPVSVYTMMRNISWIPKSGIMICLTGKKNWYGKVELCIIATKNLLMIGLKDIG